MFCVGAYGVEGRQTCAFLRAASALSAFARALCGREATLAALLQYAVWGGVRLKFVLWIAQCAGLGFHWRREAEKVFGFIFGYFIICKEMPGKCLPASRSAGRPILWHNSGRAGTMFGLGFCIGFCRMRIGSVGVSAFANSLGLSFHFNGWHV